MTAETIAAALGGGYRSGSWWRCRCPVHQSNGATLALRDAPYGGLAVHCHSGCPRDAVVAELRRFGLLDGDDAVRLPPSEVKRQREAEERNRLKRIAQALDFWHHETVSPSETAVERYWCARGLTLPLPPTIRASRSWLRHPEGGSRPVMIALVEHVDLGPVAIHRTWLQTDGLAKASFISPRLSLGPVGGGAVRLAPAAETLLVGEGIETTASAMQATRQPGWAALSTSGLVGLVLPPVVRTVIILADHDLNGAGEAAARTAARRWLAEGRRVRIAMPPIPGTDWNDVLLNKDNKEARHAA